MHNLSMVATRLLSKNWRKIIKETPIYYHLYIILLNSPRHLKQGTEYHFQGEKTLVSYLSLFAMGNDSEPMLVNKKIASFKRATLRPTPKISKF